MRKDSDIHCPICDEPHHVLRCRICFREIARHSHEGDYICSVHSFTETVTDEDLRSQMQIMERFSDQREGHR